MAQMKHHAIVGNIGHFDNEIDIAGLDRMSACNATRSSRRSTSGLSRRTRDHPAVRRPPAEPGQRHRPPELRDVASFTNQVLAQIELFVHSERYETKPRGLRPAEALDEKVARLHLDALGVRLTELSKEQADYIGCRSTARTSPTTTATEPTQ